MIGSKIDGRAVLSSRMYAIYEKLHSMDDNKQLQSRYCDFLYRMYQKNIETICRASAYEYIPNNRLNLRDRKKFILNTLDISNTTAENKHGYDIYEIDKELSDGVSKSLVESPVLYQPIWSEYSPENNTFFIFDGSHRFLALLDRLKNGLSIPETLLVVLDQRKIGDSFIELFIPDCVYEVFDIFTGRLCVDKENKPYSVLYSFSYCSTKMYAISIPYSLLKKVIVSWTMIIDLLYTHQADNQIELKPAIMVHKNIFKKDDKL